MTRDTTNPLAQARSPAEAVIGATQDAVIAIDSRSKITLCNPAAARMFGYEQGTLMGKHVNTLMAAPYAREHDEYIRRYEETGERKAIGRVRTVSGRRSDGREFPIELSVAEYDEDGERRYAAVLRDISDKVREHDARIEAEKMAAIGTTASKFAHELGNPINGMAVSVQLLRRWLQAEPPTNTRVLERVDLLMQGIERLTGLLHEFRTLSRKHEYNFEAVDLGKLVEELCAMERPHYDQRGVGIQTDVERDLGPVRADPGKLRQVLLNLCKNALEAMGSGGELTIATMRTPSGVCIEVRDTGVGVPQELDVFAPFTTSKANGSGLGLSIARQIVEAHQGTLTFEARAERGTTFRITLPS